MGRFRLIGDFRVIAAVYAVTTLIASWHKYARGGDNNLRIFRSSFVNLVNGRDLYALYPEQYWDHFNYSPTFALLMAPFAWLPEFACALLWNFCNVFAFFAAVCALSLDGRARAIVLWLVGIELLTSIQNFQSNALVAALIIATLVSFERGWPELAAVFVTFGAAIKIFGAAAALFIIFYPQKRRFLVAALIATLILFLLPLVVTSFEQLHLQYQSWFAVLKADYFTRHNLSIMNWLHTWFGLTSPNPLFQVVGAAILLLPLLRRDCYADRSSAYVFSDRCSFFFFSSTIAPNRLLLFSRSQASPSGMSRPRLTFGALFLRSRLFSRLRSSTRMWFHITFVRAW